MSLCRETARKSVSDGVEGHSLHTVHAGSQPLGAVRGHLRGGGVDHGALGGGGNHLDGHI